MVKETVIKFEKQTSGGWKQIGGDYDGYFESLMKGEWQRVVDFGYPQDEEKRDDAVTRARQKIGQGEYHFLFNNCEHFVTRMLTGQGISDQLNRVVRTAARFGSGSLVASSSSRRQ